MSLSAMLNMRSVRSMIPTQTRIPSIIQVNLLIASLYEAKIVQDAVDDREGNIRMPLPLFCSDFLARQYGLKDLAVKQLYAINSALLRFDILIYSVG